MTASVPVIAKVKSKKIDFIVQFHWRGKKHPVFGPTPRASKMLNAFDSWILKDEKKTDEIARFLLTY